MLKKLIAKIFDTVNYNKETALYNRHYIETQIRLEIELLSLKNKLGK